MISAHPRVRFSFWYSRELYYRRRQQQRHLIGRMMENREISVRHARTPFRTIPCREIGYVLLLRKGGELACIWCLWPRFHRKASYWPLTSSTTPTPRQWHHHKFEYLMNKNKSCESPSRAFFLFPYISFPFSANLRREMTIAQVLQRTCEFEFSFSALTPHL